MKQRKRMDENWFREHPIAGGLFMLFMIACLFLAGLVLVALFVAVH